MDSTCKWCHIVFVFLCLTSLSMISSRSVHVAANGNISFLFLWLSDGSLYIYTTSSLSIHLLMDTSYFHVLAIVNSAAMNIGIYYVAFVTTFFHLAQCFLGSLCCNMYQYFIPFYRQILFHCMNMPHFIYPAISWWKFVSTFWLLECCCEYLCVSFVWTYVFHSLWYISRRGIAGSYSNFMFNLLQNCFPQWLHHFIFPPAMYEGSSSSTFSPTLVIVCLFYYSHPNGCKVVSHYGFDMHFPND